MKKLFLATTAVVALAAGSATAADLAVRPALKAAPLPPIAYSWTGFYWGVNIGYSWGRETNDWTLVGFPFASETQDLNGVIGGFQSGFNWQSGAWVFGLESDFQATGQKGSTTYCVITCALANVTADHKLPWLGTSRTRIGILVSDAILLYGTAGIAYGQVKSTYTLGLPGPVAAFNFKDTRAGWTAGAGIEGALGGGWSAKLEYLYVDLGKNTSSFTVGPVLVSSFESRVTDNIARAGLNYRWGGGR